MAAFVQRCHQGLLEVALIVAHREAHIQGRTEASCEGMSRARDLSIGEIVADTARYFLAQLFLLSNREISVQAGGVDLVSAGLDTAQQRGTGAAHGREQWLGLAGGQPRPKLVEQRIVARLRVADAVSNLALQVEDALQPGGEAGKIVLLARVNPGADAGYLDARQFFDESARQLRGAVIHAAGVPYQSSISVSEVILLDGIIQLFKQFAEPGICNALMQ